MHWIEYFSTQISALPMPHPACEDIGRGEQLTQDGWQGHSRASRPSTTPCFLFLPPCHFLRADGKRKCKPKPTLPSIDVRFNDTFQLVDITKFHVVCVAAMVLTLLLFWWCCKGGDGAVGASKLHQSKVSYRARFSNRIF